MLAASLKIKKKLFFFGDEYASFYLLRKSCTSFIKKRKKVIYKFTAVVSREILRERPLQVQLSLEYKPTTPTPTYFQRNRRNSMFYIHREKADSTFSIERKVVH